MMELDIDRFQHIDNQWRQIEDSYRLDPYFAPTNLQQEKKAMLAAHAAGKSYNPYYEYDAPPNFPTQRIYEFIKTLRFENSALERFYYLAAQNELLAIEAVQTHSPNIITGHTSLIYGIPGNTLLEAARSILASTFNDSPANKDDQQISSEEAALEMGKMLKELGLRQWSARPFFPMNAKVDVSRLDNLIKIRENATFSQQEIRRLLVHEIGVHVFRGENGRRQPVGIFSRGLPGYLDTEEGLAVYSEEKAGVIEPVTMRKYAGRVIAAATALGNSFSDVFYSIVSDVGPDAAYEITARAKRGFRDTSQLGAHTKDIVYLKGYIEVSQYLSSHPGDYELLFAGKFGLREIELVRDLIEQNIFQRPTFIPSALWPER